jgi:hypothetical protein
MENEGVRTSGSEALSRSLAAIAAHIQAFGAGLQLHLRSSPKEILDECRAQRIPTIGIAITPDEATLLGKADFSFTWKVPH